MKDLISAKCPKCKKAIIWDLNHPEQNQFRPFCSAACKNNDFLDWANDQYKISRDLIQDDDEMLNPDLNQ